MPAIKITLELLERVFIGMGLGPKKTVGGPESYRWARERGLLGDPAPARGTWSNRWCRYLHARGYPVPRPGGQHSSREVDEENPPPPDFSSLLAENRRLHQELKRERDHTAVITEIIEAALAREGVLPPPKAAPRPAPRSTKADAEDMALLISDWHRGALYSRPDLSGFAADYSLEVADRRFDALIRKAERIADLQGAVRELPTLRVFLTGDMVEGEDIYRGQRYYIEGPLSEQAIGAGKRLSLGLARLSQRFERVEAYCVPGNHGRTGRKGEYHPRSNWDLISYYFAREWLREYKNVHIAVSAGGFIGVEILGHNCLATHGDMTRAWMGIPYYGLERDVRKLQDLTNLHWDVVLCSHFHRPANLPIGSAEVLMNGSICGATRYSIEQLKEAAPPRQWCFGVHPDHPMTWRYPLDLATEEEQVALSPDAHGVLTPVLSTP